MQLFRKSHNAIKTPEDLSRIIQEFNTSPEDKGLQAQYAEGTLESALTNLKDFFNATSIDDKITCINIQQRGGKALNVADISTIMNHKELPEQAAIANEFSILKTLFSQITISSSIATSTQSIGGGIKLKNLIETIATSGIFTNDIFHKYVDMLNAIHHAIDIDVSKTFCEEQAVVCEEQAEVRSTLAHEETNEFGRMQQATRDTLAALNFTQTALDGHQAIEESSFTSMSNFHDQFIKKLVDMKLTADTNALRALEQEANDGAAAISTEGLTGLMSIPANPFAILTAHHEQEADALNAKMDLYKNLLDASTVLQGEVETLNNLCKDLEGNSSDMLLILRLGNIKDLSSAFFDPNSFEKEHITATILSALNELELIDGYEDKIGVDIISNIRTSLLFINNNMADYITATSLFSKSDEVEQYKETETNRIKANFEQAMAKLSKPNMPKESYDKIEEIKHLCITLNDQIADTISSMLTQYKDSTNLEAFRDTIAETVNAFSIQTSVILSKCNDLDEVIPQIENPAELIERTDREVQKLTESLSTAHLEAFMKIQNIASAIL